MLPTPELATISEVADQFRVSVPTVRRWIAAGRIATVRLPSGRLRVRQDAIDALLRSESEDPPHAAASAI